MKNVICRKEKFFFFYLFCVLHLRHAEYTVCKSLLKSMSVKNPDPIPKGVRLIKARNFPNKSPFVEEEKKLKLDFVSY